MPERQAGVSPVRRLKVVAVTGPGRAGLVERPDPKVADNYALVRIEAAPMCTEWHAYRDGTASDCLGHEAAGIVVDAGARSGVAKGTRVVVMPQNPCGKCEPCLSGNWIRCQSPLDPYAICDCTTGRATFAELCIQQDWLLLPIPDDVSTEHASMACCGLGPAFGATSAMEAGPGDTVLVSGLGPVGLGCVVCASVRGARVVGIEGNPYRSSLAKELGASAIVDPADPEAHDKLLELTAGRGADKSIEASSQESAPAFLLQATRIGGQMASIGWGGPVNMRDVVARGVTVFGQWHWNHLRDAEAMFETIRRARPLIDKLITHRFPLDQVREAFELQLTGRCGKVVLTT